MYNDATSHYLYSRNLPKQLDHDVLEGLVQQLCEGDKTCINTIASSHIRMIISIARKLSRSQDLEDMVSVGLEGLMEAINKYPETRTEQASGNITANGNITAYIACYVRYKIFRYKAENTLIRIPQESQRRLKIRPDVAGVGESTTSRQNLVELNEILRLICDDPLEQLIVRLRRKKFTDKEISEKVGVSITLINTIRSKLEKKFGALWDA